MTSNKIHLSKQGYNCNMTVCGRIVRKEYITENKSNVTCSVCKKTIIFIK